MKRKPSLIAALSLICLCFALSGCTGEGKTDVTSAVKALPQVQQFLEMYPDAEVRAALWSAGEVEGEIQSVSEKCGKQMQVQSMWRAEIEKEDLRMVAWLDLKQTPLCIYIKSEGSQKVPDEIAGIEGLAQIDSGKELEDENTQLIQLPENVEFTSDSFANYYISNLKATYSSEEEIQSYIRENPEISELIIKEIIETAEEQPELLSELNLQTMEASLGEDYSNSFVEEVSENVKGKLEERKFKTLDAEREELGISDWLIKEIIWYFVGQLFSTPNLNVEIITDSENGLSVQFVASSAGILSTKIVTDYGTLGQIGEGWFTWPWNSEEFVASFTGYRHSIGKHLVAVYPTILERIYGNDVAKWPTFVIAVYVETFGVNITDSGHSTGLYYCGDGNCNTDENYQTCPADCNAPGIPGSGSAVGPIYNYCGDGNCASDENCASCPQDCGVCTMGPDENAPSGSGGMTGGVSGISQCAQASFRILSCAYTPESNSVEVKIESTSAVDLNGFWVNVEYSDGNATQMKINTYLPAENSVQLIGIASATPAKVKVQSVECSSVKDSTDSCLFLHEI